MRSLLTFSRAVLLLLLATAAAFSQSIKIGDDDDQPGFRKRVEDRISSMKVRVIENGKTVEKKIAFADVCPVDTDPTAHRIFLEYGAIFLAENGVKIPAKCIFANEGQVNAYQLSAESATEFISGTSVTLQKPAMEALLKAIKEAKKKGLKITPRGGSTASKRSYEDTRRIWDSRFLPGLTYWVRRGKLKQSEADEARQLGTAEQIRQVLEWEDDRQLYFSTDMSKSILYSVAAPGASQHIFMLALDVTQFSDSRVRAILAQHGWFQTVKSDAPHFTYLGLKESELPEHGLKKVIVGGQDFWIPDFE